MLRLIGNPARYLGIDLAEAEIARNRERWLGARFQVGSVYETGLPNDSADWAISTYTLEHCVWPEKLLREMVRVARPGGHVAVLCPEFRPGRMNSMWEGTTARQSFYMKLRSLSLLDAGIHLAGQRLLAPLALKFAHAYSGRFLILTDPRCLRVPVEAWNPDTDAVYWSYGPEVREELERDCEIEQFEATAGKRHPGIIYIVGRKRG